MAITEEDKQAIIKQLCEELNYYKKFTKEVRIDIDKKLAVLSYAIENEKNYHYLK